MFPAFLFVMLFSVKSVCRSLDFNDQKTNAVYPKLDHFIWNTSAVCCTKHTAFYWTILLLSFWNIRRTNRQFPTKTVVIEFYRNKLQIKSCFKIFWQNWRKTQKPFISVDIAKTCLHVQNVFFFYNKYCIIIILLSWIITKLSFLKCPREHQQPRYFSGISPWRSSA